MLPMYSEEIKTMDIQELLGADMQYVIPIYQRNYAWESKEIEQLIQDIIDYATNHPGENYYLGTLVVAAEKNNGNTYWSTIDGQQRITTLSILSAVIKNNYKQVDLSWFDKLNLRFASRQKSTLSMQAAFAGSFDGEEYEHNIKSAYEICNTELEKKCNEYDIDITQFAAYLYQFVKIMRVPLPEGIDLNHYFEIMNSRGEQLEKHEILKARLMESFNGFEEKERNLYEACFNLIWEACSNMEKYVQYGFTPDQRHLIFGREDWNSLAVYDFDGFVDKISPTLVNDTKSIAFSLDEILNGHSVIVKEEDKSDAPDRFNSVVNFQNFLLHVLRVQIADNDVALDDKRLIDLFVKAIPTDKKEKIEFVKEFIFNLLKCKFLFDKYVIKREFTANTDRWSLKSLKWYSSGKVKNGVKYTNTFGDDQNESFDSDNRRILMLLSMFHVSLPSMTYKYWLNASLNYLFKQFDIDGKNYIQYLEHIAKSFVFDRYLVDNPKDYFEMIYINLSPVKRSFKDLNLDKLRYGQIENNLLFNFIDYLLWLSLKDIDKDSRVKTYEYTFRSSVEHYYPQTPINKDIDEIAEKYLHSFGNLCLISHEKNSRFSNYSPNAKKEQYDKSISLDSIKQFLMMKYSTWSIKEIEEHNNAMMDLLKQNLNSDFSFSSDVSTAQRWFKEYQSRDRNLLVRALLCFGDCLPNIGGDRFNLFDLDYIRNDEAFTKFEEYIDANNPKGLSEIIKKHVSLASIKKDYRYLFIKYPALLEYSKEGNFLWENEGSTITLLEYSKRTEHKAKEALTYILAKHFLTETGFEPFTDYTTLYLNIKYDDGVYSLIGDKEFKEADLQLEIWNNEGHSINACVIPYANGNSSSVKMLQEYKWVKNEEGNFERFGNPKLINLEDDYELNISNMIEAVYKLFKNGFGIKLL